MALLEFQNVSKTYDGVTKALQEVTFSIEEGEFVSIIGPSGAGKSTLLRCVNRLIDTSPRFDFVRWAGCHQSQKA